MNQQPSTPPFLASALAFETDVRHPSLTAASGAPLVLLFLTRTYCVACNPNRPGRLGVLGGAEIVAGRIHRTGNSITLHCSVCDHVQHIRATQLLDDGTVTRG